MTPERLKRMYEIVDYKPEDELSKGGKRMAIMMGIIIAVAAIGIGSAIIVKKDDAPIEETAEAIIKLETGQDVDLTPLSKER